MKKYILIFLLICFKLNVFSQGTMPCIWNGVGTPTFNGGKNGCMVVYHTTSDSVWVWGDGNWLISDTGTDVVFAEGTGIELSQSADTLTISATGLGGIYAGSGDIPTGTVAKLEEDSGSFSIDWFYSDSDPAALSVDEATKTIRMYSDGGYIQLDAQNVSTLFLGSNGLIGLYNTGFDLGFSNTSVIFTDSYHGKGIQYDTDYSSTFVDRSLVDKAYVDNNDTNIGNTDLTTPTTSTRNLNVGSQFRIRPSTLNAAFVIDTAGYIQMYAGNNILRVTKDSTSVVTPDPFNISAGFSIHKYYSGLSLEGSDLTGLFTATVNFEGNDVGLVANDVLSLNAASGGSSSFGVTGEGALEIGVAGTNGGQPTLSAVTGSVYVEADRLIVEGELRVTDLTSGTPVDAVGVDADGDLVTMPFTSDQLTLVSTWTNLTGSELTAYKQGSRVTIQGVIKGMVIPSAGTTDICTTLPSEYQLTLGGFQAFAVVDGTLYPVAVQMILGNIDVQSLSGSSIDLTGADDYLIIQNTYYKN